MISGALPTDQSRTFPRSSSALVILVLLMRPAGAVRAREAARWSGYDRRRRAWPQLAGAGRCSSWRGAAGLADDRASQIYFLTALVAVAFVVALYVFVGNSGVVSFGHISFVAVGAWAAGVLTVPRE